MTRREFDRLDRKVADIDEGGTRKVGILEERQRETRDEFRAFKVDVNKDMGAFRKKLDKNTTALWGLAIVLLTGCIGIIVALMTQNPG